MVFQISELISFHIYSKQNLMICFAFPETIFVNNVQFIGYLSAT